METFEIKMCPLCTGKATLECTSCHGSGKVLNPNKSHAYHSSAPTLILCNICIGTGKIMCNYCKGSGKIVVQK
jgi:DnaJ-class molecular chaperone